MLQLAVEVAEDLVSVDTHRLADRVPAARVLDLIPEFQKKGIRNMLLITSGFAETGKDGRRLEEKLVKAAREAGVLGKDVAGFGRSFDIEIFISPGGYILGEETALLEALNWRTEVSKL